MDFKKSVNNYEQSLYSAIIIEFRKHNALHYVLNNFLKNLSNEWNIIIFHGNKNKNFVHDIVNNSLSQYESRITIIHLPYDNMSAQEYSQLLMNKDISIIYDNIPTELFLVFQTDSVIIEQNKDFINEFLNYDYVGAPWSSDSNHVGNGGLSLRRKSKMIEIIEKEDEYRRQLPEDVFFAQSTKTHLNKPDPYEATKFSIENWLGCGVSFGCHKPWTYLQDYCNKHPEIVELYALQNCTDES